VFDLTTVYYQWHLVLLEIYDLFGRRMYSREILKAEKTIEIYVSDRQALLKEKESGFQYLHCHGLQPVHPS